jgi:hypothetical protein
MDAFEQMKHSRGTVGAPQTEPLADFAICRRQRGKQPDSLAERCARVPQIGNRQRLGVPFAISKVSSARFQKCPLSGSIVNATQPRTGGRAVSVHDRHFAAPARKHHHIRNQPGMVWPKRTNLRKYQDRLGAYPLVRAIRPDYFNHGGALRKVTAPSIGQTSMHAPQSTQRD